MNQPIQIEHQMLYILCIYCLTVFLYLQNINYDIHMTYIHYDIYDIQNK